MDSPDLQFKYQKLAFEYSKLRAQNQVLKKAVLEEQEKSNQFKEDLKLQDQSVRKAEQEIDSLSFRNQQLTKRLSLLQDDLEIIKNKPRKGRTKLDSQLPIPIHDNNVYAEELELKIRENARLHAEVTDLENFYKTKVSELELHLEGASRTSVKTNEQRLQNEIKILEGELSHREAQAQQREARIISLEGQLKSYILENKSNANANSKVSSFELERPCNLPVTLETVNKPSNGHFILNFSKPMEEVCFGFAKFFVSYASLVRKSPTIPSSQLKLVDQLINEKSNWHLLHQRYEEMLSGIGKEETIRVEDLIGMNEFNKAFNNCSSSLRRLLPVLSEKWICCQDGQLDASWSNTLCRIVSCFAAINPYISSLAAHNDGRVTLSALAVRKILALLHERICKLHSTSQELLTAVDHLKINDEKEEQTLKSPLASIEGALYKIKSIFWEHVLSSEESENSGSSSANSRSPATPIISSQSLAYLGSTDSNMGVGNLNEGIVQFASSETCLTQQLAQATSRLAKLEEEREHWRLECQLLSHRLNKGNMASPQMSEDVRDLSSDKVKDQHKDTNLSDESSNIPKTSVSFMSEIVGRCSTDEREKEIRSHFTNRCSQLYMQLTSCISQTALYQNECENLLKRLAIIEDAKYAAEREAERQTREKVQIQETLSTTSRNYEEQISTMSDHLADLNEKITTQADTIEHMKFELKKKVKK